MADQTDNGSTTESEVLARLAVEAAAPTRIDEPGSPYVVRDPGGASVLDLERFLPAPRRKQGTYQTEDVQSFADYVSNHADPDATTIWVNQMSAALTAVINDNAADRTGWRDHRALLKLIRTPEWEHWLSQDGRLLSQEAFAQHVEDGVAEIREPDAATMLEIAQTFQGKTNVEWKSATRLDNGQVSLAYTEEIEATAGKAGNEQIPQQMLLAIAPFYGEQPFQVNARLRYRVEKGVLRIGYRIDHPKKVELEVLGVIVERLRAKDGLGRIYMGTPA